MADLITKPRFTFSFATDAWQALATKLVTERYLFPMSNVQKVFGGEESYQEPIERLTRSIKMGLSVRTSHEAMEFFHADQGLVSLGTRRDFEESELRSYLLDLKFDLMAANSPFSFNWQLEHDYRGSSFSDLHQKHGWACAFRGQGHDRLVSRRWLKYAGPWSLIRNEERDVSFVQFHSLDADAETALEQAKPGHQRMGISDTGGFIQTSFVYRYDWDGMYLPDDEILEIVVHGREVEQREMLEACALRHYQPLGEDQPLANVRYVFMTEENARKHLRELWLRELECWAIVDGQKVRLDEDYDPGEPPVPEWARDEV